MITALRTRNDDRLYWVAIGILIAIAWVVTALTGASHLTGHVAHGDLRIAQETVGPHHHGVAKAVPPSLPIVPALLIFVGGWTAMTVAMMLPTSLPMINLFRATVRNRQRPAILETLLVSGYLGVWVLFGLLVFAADAGVHGLVARVSAFSRHGGYLLPAVLLVAGLYQFTPLKDRCLRACRSPMSFLVTHWRGISPAREAFRLGAHHGLFCVGCCWTLMLVMFALGAAHLPAMLALGVVMAVEKCMPWGRRLVAPAGVGLVLLGIGLGLWETLARFA